VVTDKHEVLRAIPVGDTGARFVFTAGREGKAPDELVFLKDEGYAVVRSWTSDRFSDGLYLVFLGASHTELAHKHQDDLSFILHSCGRALIDDAGHNSYQNDANRAFTVGPYAHNSVVIGNPDIVAWRYGTAKARLTSAVRHDGFTEASGFTDEHPVYRHTRTLLLLDRGALVVIDRLTPKPGASRPARAEFVQLFNFGDGLLLDMTAPGVIHARASDSDRPVMDLQVIAPTDASLAVIRGQAEPMIGWTAPRFGDPLRQSSALAIRTAGTAATIATVLSFQRDCGRALQPADVSAHHDESGSLSLEWGGEDGVRQRWTLGH
jgi:hypothetical protein